MVQAIPNDKKRISFFTKHMLKYKLGFAVDKHSLYDTPSYRLCAAGFHGNTHKISVVATRTIYSWLYRSSGIEQGRDLAS